MALAMYSVAVVSHRAAEMVGERSHISQVRVSGIFPSRAAFARHLHSEGLSDSRSVRTAIENVKTYGNDMPLPRYEANVPPEILANPGVLFIESLNRYGKDRSPLRWPGKETT